MIKVGEGDPAAYNQSYSYADKRLRSIRKKVSNNIKATWVPPPICLVHWDEKITTTLDGCDKEKRMVLVVSCIEETKLLGVPSIGT